MKQMRQKLLMPAGCLVCAVVCWKSFLVFDGTEFGSGSLAGNQVFASFLFILALALAFKYPRSAFMCFGSLRFLPATIPLPCVPTSLSSGVARRVESLGNATRDFHLGWVVDYRNPLHDICGMPLRRKPYT